MYPSRCRQDLLSDKAGVERWAGLLSEALTEILVDENAVSMSGARVKNARRQWGRILKSVPDLPGIIFYSDTLVSGR